MAQSCPSADGAGYTHVDTGSATSYTLGAGDSLLISSGTFSGFINALPAGARICVNTGATFQPGGANNVSGEIENHGTAVFRWVNFGAGTTLRNLAGLMTFESTNANGPIHIFNPDGATIRAVGNGNMTIPGGSTVENHGTIDFANNGILELQVGSTAVNTGRIHMNGNDFNTGGNVQNSGYIDGVGELHVNAGSFANACSAVEADRIINSGVMTNEGFFVVSGGTGFFTNNGSLSQEPGAVIAGADFVNDGSVSGHGRYYFSGQTRNQGPFHGSDPADPIVFYDATRTAPPEFFDIQNSMPTNVVRQAFVPPAAEEVIANCSVGPVQADLYVSKSNGLDAVVAGQTVIYGITVGNAGSGDAVGVRLHDVANEGLTCTHVSCAGGTGGAQCPVEGGAPGQLSIDNLMGDGVLIDLPLHGELEFAVTCTATE